MKNIKFELKEFDIDGKKETDFVIAAGERGLTLYITGITGIDLSWLTNPDELFKNLIFVEAYKRSKKFYEEEKHDISEFEKFESKLSDENKLILEVI